MASVPHASTSSSTGERQLLNPLALSFTYNAANNSRISSDASYEDNYKRARTLSPSRDSISISDYSFDSVLPSIHSFKRNHQIVSYISLLSCVLLFATLSYWREGSIGWAELALGASAWLVSEALKEGIFELFTYKCYSDGVLIKGAGKGIGIAIHSATQELLRLGGIILVVALLPDTISPALVFSKHTSMPFPPPLPPNNPRRPLPPLDLLFFSALYFSMGWAFVEILFGSKQFWKYITLYDDVLDEVSEIDEEEGRNWEGEEEMEGEEEQYILNGGGVMSQSVGSEGVGYGATAYTSRPTTTEIPLEIPAEHKSLQFLTNSAFERVVSGPLAREEEEAEAEARIRRIEREELEATLGVPLYVVPTFIVFVWRLDAILLSIDLSLLLALPFRTTAPTLLFFPIWPTFFAATGIHVALSLLWTLGIRYFGIPAISYATLVTLVFALFAVLGLWGSLE